jgi:2-polyprenyl-3-methyl-5-hydroxy-6-metoxy-1,4-benzoquinol methylase
VGPGDGPGLPILSQAVDHVYACDWDNRLIEGNQRRLHGFKNITHICRDLNKQDIEIANIDAAVTVDVIEHLDPTQEDVFLQRICKTLHPNSIMIHGTPNIEANKHASSQSKAQHINLKSYDSLRELSEKYCINTLMFTQNDECVGTGFPGMAHYLWCVGVGIRGKYLL